MIGEGAYKSSSLVQAGRHCVLVLATESPRGRKLIESNRIKRPQQVVCSMHTSWQKLGSTHENQYENDTNSEATCTNQIIHNLLS